MAPLFDADKLKLDPMPFRVNGKVYEVGDMFGGRVDAYATSGLGVDLRDLGAVAAGMARQLALLVAEDWQDAAEVARLTDEFRAADPREVLVTVQWVTNQITAAMGIAGHLPSL